MNLNESTGITREKFYRIPELAGRLSTGRRTLDAAINRGDLKAVSLNRRGDRRVLGEWAVQWLEEQQVPR